MHGQLTSSPSSERGRSPPGACSPRVPLPTPCGSTWDGERLVGRVGACARAVALDMPGFGQADKPKTGFEYTVAGYAAHLGAALDELGITRAHLVLHDFGGPWGLAWAVDHPDTFASV